MFPAFKEWQVIVTALAAGEQSLILRKGGIAEGRSGFDPIHAERFWLFPTQFHAQREKTKPATARHFDRVSPALVDAPIALTAFAEIVYHRFLADWATVAALDAFHGWTEAAVREKFEWSKPAGLHALVVRVHHLHQPVLIARSAAMVGCKSWIEVPCGFDDQPSSVVVPQRPIADVIKQLGG